MKKYFLFYFYVFLLISCVSCASKFQTLPADEFEQRIADTSVCLIDVRSAEEFAEGHIPGAINIEWGKEKFDFDKQVKMQVPKYKTVAIYCLHAKRSKLAAERMCELAYKNVFHLKGGIESWISEGKTVVLSSGKTVGNVAMVPYMEANHYFVRNDAPDSIPTYIGSQQLFDSIFDDAAVMGEEGMPTDIDFNHQFVIAHVCPPSKQNVFLLPKRLSATADTLALEYVSSVSETKTYTSQTSLIIVVDRMYERPEIIVKAINENNPS